MADGNSSGSRRKWTPGPQPELRKIYRKKYCVVGIEIRLRITPWTIEVFFVPRVEHHMAALHVMASDEFTKEPYIEWAGIFGVVQKWMLDGLAGVFDIPESGNRQSRYSHYGEHQATHLKEVELLGHPVAILPRLVDSTGSISIPAEYRDAGSGHSVETVNINAFVDRWVEWAGRCFSVPESFACRSSQPRFPGAYLSQFFSVLDAIDTILGALELIEGVVDFAEMAERLWEIADTVGSEGFGAGGGVRIDRLLCPNDIQYFQPYYLSGPDVLFWRSGFPITDARHAATLLNPFSHDRVRPTDGAWFETWGHLYPRAGFLNNDHPGRAAAVIARRGAHLLADPEVSLRPKRTTADANGHWQKISPEPTRYCEANVADLPTPIDNEGGYGYNVWAKYTCPLSEVGFMVAFIPYRYCF